MKEKQYIIGFNTNTGMPRFWGEYADTKEVQRLIEEQIALNYGNKHCCLIVSEKAYRKLLIRLDKTSELFDAQIDLFEASQSLQKAMGKIKKVVDKP